MLRRLSALTSQLQPPATQHTTRTMSMNADVLKTGPKELENPGVVLLLAQTPNAGKVTYLTEELKSAFILLYGRWVGALADGLHCAQLSASSTRTPSSPSRSARTSRSRRGLSNSALTGACQ